MAFAFVNSEYNSGTGSSVSVNKPTNTAENDIMFAWCACSDQLAISAPAGWTKQTELSYGRYYRLYYKVAGASEGASYSFTTNSGYTNKITIATFRGGFKTATPIDSSSIDYGSKGTSVTGGSITVAATNSPLLFFAACMQSTLTFTKDNNPTSGWTEHVDANSMQVCSITWSSSGSTGNVTSTMSSSALPTGKAGCVVSLQPAAAGPANLKSYNTNLKANIKSINGNPIANCKSLNGNS